MHEAFWAREGRGRMIGVGLGVVASAVAIVAGSTLGGENTVPPSGSCGVKHHSQEQCESPQSIQAVEPVFSQGCVRGYRRLF